VEVEGWESHTLEPTEPPPTSPPSDIRMIGGQRHRSGDDPLAMYVEALSEPAIETEARTLPPPRHRRETVKLTMPTPGPMRLRQATLLMLDRPLRSPPPSDPLCPATPAMAILVPRRERGAPEKAPPAPFRAAAPVLICAFVAGIALAAVIAFAIAHL
jgi:hypothetical protein